MMHLDNENSQKPAENAVRGGRMAPRGMRPRSSPPGLMGLFPPFPGWRPPFHPRFGPRGPFMERQYSPRGQSFRSRGSWDHPGKRMMGPSRTSGSRPQHGNQSRPKHRSNASNSSTTTESSTLVQNDENEACDDQAAQQKQDKKNDSQHGTSR